MLTIGQFSRVCQVSVKALHHYDRIGLMHPDSVDRWTGYRYYDEKQIPTMLLILRLKRYGFTLSEISAFLDEDDAARAVRMLKARQAQLRAEIEATGSIIKEMDAHVRDYERTGNIMSYQNNYEIKVEVTETMPILSLRQNMSVEAFGEFYGKLFEKVAREKVTTNGKVMAFYHDEEFNPECSDIEVAVGLNGAEHATRMLESATAVTTIHKGAYSGLTDAYGALTRYIAENGYEIAGSPYEIYLNTRFDNAPIEQWETKVIFPVKKK